jgi:uncharacterized protein with LGFP repeats
VVSCRPPWEFEQCSTAPATDNRTRDHNSDRLPQSWTPITAHYLELGEMGSVLGATVYGEAPAPGGGSFQRYQHGRISWSPTTGAHALTGPLLAKYLELGAEAGPLGYPTSDEQGATRTGPFKRIGSQQERRVVFQRGILAQAPGGPVTVVPLQPAAPSPAPTPVVSPAEP